MTIDNLTGKRIVFAEDDADDKDFFMEVVQSINPQIHIEWVSNGSRLMTLLKHFVPDLLFLDLEMPSKNGLECLVEIRSMAALDGLPIIVFSSSSRPGNIQTAYEMGAHLFLVKSQTFSAYTDSLKKILELDWSYPEEIRESHCVNHQYVAFDYKS